MARRKPAPGGEAPTGHNIPFSRASIILDQKHRGASALIRGYFLRDGVEDDINRARPLREWGELYKSIVGQ